MGSGAPEATAPQRVYQASTVPFFLCPYCAVTEMYCPTSGPLYSYPSDGSSTPLGTKPQCSRPLASPVGDSQHLHALITC